MTRPRCITCGNTFPCSCADLYTEIDVLKAESRSLLEQAREARQRDAFKRPILDAFDRLGRKP